jgi:uncharacterized protein YecE (DUF72 family)
MAQTDFDLPYYRARIAALAQRGIYVGTSSWTYPGWLGQIYTAERYEYRGRFATARFEANCLREYAETFRTVCFDGAYYTFYGEDKWRAMAEQVGPGFRFGLKVPEMITVKRWPNLDKHREHAGQINGDFLNADLFCMRFLQPLEAIRANVGPIIFEFSKFYPSEYKDVAEFVADLDRFFAAMPKTWAYSIELRNRKWLGPEYLACLKRHGVAHCWNNWTDMPAVSEQFGMVGELPTDDLEVARFLLKPGRKYAEAVEKFQPYKITQDINEDARGALQALVDKRWVRLARNGTYVYINNRLEGNALNTVLAVLDRIEALKSVPRPTPVAKVAAKPAQDQFDLGM